MGRAVNEILRRLQEAADTSAENTERGINAEYAKLGVRLRSKRHITLPHEDNGREIEKIFRETKQGVEQ